MNQKFLLLFLWPIALYAAFAQNVTISVKQLFVSRFFMSSPKVGSPFRQNTLAVIYLLLAIIGFQGYEVKAQTTGYTWKNAPIGGGGFVTGIVTHPTSSDRYCRTDVGGAYRWDATNEKWTQLLDWFNESENGFYGVESLALDPQNPNNVYMLCGTSYINNGRTAILKSTDKGNTFTYTDVTSQFKAHGNGSGRGNGERLVVDPNNSNVLFVGTRYDGLWKSTDAGVTWNQIWNGVTTTTNGNGICFVVFDPSSSVVGGVTQTMYIGVSRTGGGNVYKSTDGGVSFTDITATTGFMPHRAALQGTTMYVTYSDHQGPQSTNGDGKVYKLNTATGAWTNVTPVHNKDYCYGGVSIDPTNVDRVIVSTSGIYWNNQFGTGWADFVFLSTDGGSSWALKIGPNSTYDASGMEWSRGGAINWMDCIEFDQDDLNKVRVIGGGGVFTCSDITATNTTWKYDVKGIEETALLDGTSIPGGPFISSFGDVSGFVHEPLTSFPTTKLSPLGGYNNNSIAYAGANPSKVVRIANEGDVVYYSNDMGASWTASATNMGTAGRVSVSADGGTIVHCPWMSSTTYYTTNNGGSWSGCSGVSVGNAVPVADQVNPNYFYIYNHTNGQMLRSSNKGASFSVAGTPGGTTANHPWEPILPRTAPGKEGHVWVPLGGNGLRYSTDHGATFTNLTNVTYCRSVGIGKAMSGATYPTVFIWGTVSGVMGLFRSTDQGATWLRINDDAHEFGGAPFLIGDMNVAGRVYQAPGGGRGLIYWDPVSGTNNYTLTTATNGSGTISVNPAGGTYTAGTEVTVMANPASGWQFSGWSGDLSGSTNPMTITMNSNKSITATFTNGTGQATDVHVQSIITGTQGAGKGSKYGTATVTIYNNLGNAVSNATITGTFSGSFNETVSGITDSNGTVTLVTNGTVKGSVTVDFCVDNVTHSSLTYAPAQNVITCTGAGSSSAKISSAKSEASIDAEKILSEVIIYPNPSQGGVFQLHNPWKNEKVNISIFDIQGKLVYEQSETGKEHVVVNSKLGNGFYLVKVQSEKETITRKLIVK
jgi:hypothetical protein